MAAFLTLAPAASMAADGLDAQANQNFLAANATKSGVIKLPDGLQYSLLHNGMGPHPGQTDMVSISYNGKLINGAVFDATSPGLPVTAPLNNLIRGLNEALRMMHVGDRWQLVMPSALAYGSQGSHGGAVPPNQALIFDLTLLSTAPATSADAQSGTSLTLLTGNGGHEAVLTLHP